MTNEKEKQYREEFEEWAVVSETSKAWQREIGRYNTFYEEYKWQTYLAACKKREEEIRCQSACNAKEIGRLKKQLSEKQEEIDKVKGFWRPIMEKFETKYPDSGNANIIALTTLTEAFDIHCENEQLKKQLEETEKELYQQRFNNKHNLSIDQKVSDEIASLKKQLEDVKATDHYKKNQFWKNAHANIQKENNEIFKKMEQLESLLQQAVPWVEQYYTGYESTEEWLKQVSEAMK